MVSADRAMAVSAQSPGAGAHHRADPADVVDTLLWRDAQRMLGRHAAPDDNDQCGWCGDHWPCSPRRLAERAEAASRRPWRESWTARHELNTLPEMSGTYGLTGHRGDGNTAVPHGRRPDNRGPFG